MGNIYKKLALVGALLSGFFLGAPFLVFAQSNYVFVQQSQVTASSTYFSRSLGGGEFSQNWVVSLGSGYTGTTTEAFMTGTYTVTTPSSQFPMKIAVVQFDDSSYSVNEVVLCEFDSPDTAGTYPASGSFVQLNPNGCSGALFNPAKFYQLDIILVSHPTHVDWVNYRGIANSPFPFTLDGSTPDPQQPDFLPQFSLTGNGFFITATTTQSGLDLSGAREFCNNQFGSSTNLVNGIGSDIANAFCLTVGFMFIPSPSSIQNFTDLSGQFANKFPFSWVTNMRTDFSALTASSSDNFVSLDLNFGTSTKVLGVQDLKVIGTSTISQYLSDDTRTTIKVLIATSFWLLAAAYIYRHLQNVWSNGAV